MVQYVKKDGVNMKEINKKDVLEKFIDDLSKPVKNISHENHYINCCLNSIMKWDDKSYWKQINLNSQNLLNKSIKELCENENYHIRSSSDVSNKIYIRIYGNKKIVGNDYHGYLLWATLRNISIKEAMRELTDDDFKDYRISHVWGCTKNFYLNNLPFNFFAIPSFCYCLSDKNNGGKIGEKFRFKLKKQVIEKCHDSIVLYNRKMVELADNIMKNLNEYIIYIANTNSKKLENEKEYYVQRISFILEQFILIPNYVSKIDVEVDDDEWKDWIENGLKIFIYEKKNNEIKFNKKYLENKSKLLN